MNLLLFDVTSTNTLVRRGSTSLNVHLFRQRVVSRESIRDDAGSPALFDCVKFEMCVQAHEREIVERERESPNIPFLSPPMRETHQHSCRSIRGKE